MKPYNFNDTRKAVQNMREGKLNAVIHAVPILLSYIAKDPDCKVQLAGKSIHEESYGVAVAKGSILKRDISNLIRTYREEGFFDDLQRKWMSSDCQRRDQSRESEAHRFGVTYMFGSFLLMMVGFAACVLILCCECCVNRWKRKYVVNIV